MGTAACDGDALDGRAAGTAGLSGTRVDVVVELEETRYAVGVYVVGDGGAAQLDGVLEDLDEGGAEAGEFVAGEASGLAAGADSGVEESFVGVDVADSVEEGLVEERGFDGSLAIAEESDEVFEGDGEGLAAGAGVGGVLHGETAEAARVDEAKLLTVGERENGVGVGRVGDFGGVDEEAAGHAEVDEELRGLLGAAGLAGEVKGDGLADAVDAVDAGVGEGLGDDIGRRLEGLRLVAGFNTEDSLAVDAGVNSVGYGFYFGKLGHAL